MELASATGTSTASAAATPSGPSSPIFTSPDGQHNPGGDQTDGLANSPLLLPGTRGSARDMEMPDLSLDKPALVAAAETKKAI